jgi:hypothetical protein
MVALTKKEGPKDEQSRRTWLKTKHKLGTNSAWRIAERASGKGGEEDTPEKYLAAAVLYVEEQYAGKKSALRPIYDELLSLQIPRPRRQSLPLQNHRSALSQARLPASQTRHQLVHCSRPPLLTKANFPRLIDTGGLAKKDRITHRIEVTSAAQIDADLKKWLRDAYDLDA